MPGRALGYAGGPGPQNLADEIPRLLAAAGMRAFWIDMEFSLHDEHDRFDTHRCRSALMAMQGLRTAAALPGQEACGRRPNS